MSYSFLRLTNRTAAIHSRVLSFYFTFTIFSPERPLEWGNTPCHHVFQVTMHQGVRDLSIRRVLPGRSVYSMARALRWFPLSFHFSTLSLSQLSLGAPRCVVLRTYRGCPSVLCQHALLIQATRAQVSPEHSVSG